MEIETNWVVILHILLKITPQLHRAPNEREESDGIKSTELPVASEITKGGCKMSQTIITFDELEANLFKDRMEKMFQEAYEKGVEDGMKKFSYPPTLRNHHLADILQIAMPTVNKITASPSFPRLTNIKSRYPRDAVFQWIEQNTSLLKEVM
jgi:predicted DNA-binding transcriptional regulator AlpA